MQYAVLNTSWGWFGYVVQGRRLVATYLPASREKTCCRLAAAWPEARPAENLLPSFRSQVLRYYEGMPVTFRVAFDLDRQSAFQREVLAACRTIPYGQTASYADLARAVGRPLAARAVGTVMAHNPLPLIIPCHRVVRADGSLGGFSSPEGTRQKQRMLLLENAIVPARYESRKRVLPAAIA